MAFLDWLRSSVGLGRVVEERSALVRADPSSVLAPLPLWAQLQRIGGSLTPAQVSAIVRDADIGYMYRLVDLGNEARQKDCHLQSILGTRETALTGLDWQIDAGEDARLKDRKAAEFVQEALEQSENFPQLIAHLVGGNYQGYAVAETMLAKDSGKLVPRSFLPVSSRRFVFDIDTGKLHQFDLFGGNTVSYPGVDLLATYPGKFLQFQPRITGDVPNREGLARVLVWAALFRNWDLRDWLSLGELAWKPWRIGTYSKGAAQPGKAGYTGEADRKDISALRSILDTMSASGSAVIPDTATIEVQWPKNPPSGGGTHSELYSVMGSEMSKAVLGQTLTTEQGSVGSQALGNVHDKVRRDILESDAIAVAACIRRHLIAPLIRLNFGADVKVPEFKFLTEDAVNLESYSKAVLNFKTAGLRMKAADIRDVAGFAEPDDDDETIGGAPEIDIPIDPSTGLPSEPDPNAPPEAEAA